MEGEFQKLLKFKIHNFIQHIYDDILTFPSYELYGVSSQLRRSSLSIMLNVVEGYARINSGEKRHFFQIAYGSMKETKYLLYFSMTRKYIKEASYDKLNIEVDEIGKMLWRTITPLAKKIR